MTNLGEPDGRGEPLRAHRLFRTRDLDEARANVSRSFCPHRLEGIGAMRGFDTVHNKASGRALSLNYLRYGAEVRIDPGDLDDFYLIQFPLRGKALVVNGGHEVLSHESQAVVLNPSLRSRLEWQAGCEKLIVQVGRKALQMVAEDLIGHRLERPIVFSPAIDGTRPEVAGWARALRSCMMAAERGADRWGEGNRNQAVLEEQLIARFLICQPSVIQHFFEEGAVQEATCRHVRRARAFIHANLVEPLTLSRISKAAGCSIRALQLAFRNHLGCTPTQYMRDERLRVAHYHLLTAPEGTLVGDIAYDVGFSHLGRFSIDYRRAFGQSPSATLRRSRPVALNFAHSGQSSAKRDVTLGQRKQSSEYQKPNGSKRMSETVGITRADEGINGVSWTVVGQTYTPKLHTENAMIWHAHIPSGTFVPPHVHPTQDEWICVMDGQLEVECGDDVHKAGPGDTVRMPMGIVHAIYNRSGAVANVVFGVAPSRKLYALFGELDGLTDPEELVRISALHEVDFLPPA